MRTTFLVILIDLQGDIDFQHPTEIVAESKEQVMQLITSNVPKEYIYGIFTVDEFNKKFNTRYIPEIVPENFGKPENIANNTQAINTEVISTDINKSTEFNNPIKEQTTNSIKYFIDNGIQYKLDNGMMFKKVWQTVPIEEHMNEQGEKVFPEFRIVNKETGKQLKSNKYAVEQLIWKKLDSN